MPIETFGQKANLKSGPRSMETKPFGGKVESFGGHAPLNESPGSMGNFWRGGGKIDTQGTKAPLNETPRKGWESYPTPMSERAKKQSQ